MNAEPKAPLPDVPDVTDFPVVPPAPYFHSDSGSVRFWVPVDGHSVGASVRRDTLHYVFSPGESDEDPLATYRAYSAVIDDAVRRRVLQGSIEPVMLREFDLRNPPS